MQRNENTIEMNNKRIEMEWNECVHMCVCGENRSAHVMCVRETEMVKTKIVSTLKY